MTDALEVAPGDPQVFWAHDAVDEPEGELEPLGVFEQSGQAGGAGINRHRRALFEPPANGGYRRVGKIGLGQHASSICAQG